MAAHYGNRGFIECHGPSGLPGTLSAPLSGRVEGEAVADVDILDGRHHVGASVGEEEGVRGWIIGKAFGTRDGDPAMRDQSCEGGWPGAAGGGELLLRCPIAELGNVKVLQGRCLGVEGILLWCYLQVITKISSLILLLWHYESLQVQETLTSEQNIWQWTEIMNSCGTTNSDHWPLAKQRDIHRRIKKSNSKIQQHGSRNFDCF